MISHISFSAVMVILGMHYFSTTLVKKLLEFFIDKQDLVYRQAHSTLDLFKHIKDD